MAQWRRVAAAASVAAILGAGALVWGDGFDTSEQAVVDDAPESMALARVVAAYPDEIVFTSMIQTARTDLIISGDDQ